MSWRERTCGRMPERTKHAADCMFERLGRGLGGVAQGVSFGSAGRRGLAASRQAGVQNSSDGLPLIKMPPLDWPHHVSHLGASVGGGPVGGPGSGPVRTSSSPRTCSRHAAMRGSSNARRNSNRSRTTRALSANWSANARSCSALSKSTSHRSRRETNSSCSASVEPGPPCTPLTRRLHSPADTTT